MRTAIQMGLGRYTEYLYLSYPNWSEIPDSQHPWVSVPESLKENTEPFRYYGLDINPESIALLANMHYDNENASFMCVGVGERQNILEPDDKITDGGYPFLKGRINFLVMPFSDIIRMLDISDISVLAVDVDGYEPGLVRDMRKWDILPTYITMEMHYDKDMCSRLCQDIQSYGYELTGIVDHIPDPQGRIVQEYQFLSMGI